MNKVFKVKWNSSLQRFDITSELTKGKSKCSSGNSKKTGVQLRHAGILSMAALAMGLTAPSMAAEIEVDAFDSKDGGHVQSITGNDKLISSSWNNIAAGDPGYIRMSVREAILQGKLRDLDSGATLADLDKGNLVTGQMVGYDYYDANIGNVATFQGYNNNELKMANVLDQSIPLAYAVGVDGQYVDRNLIQVTGGGTLDVSVGDSSGSDWFNDPNNRLKLYMKGDASSSAVSSVFKVGVASTIDYNSKTVVHLGNFNNQAKNIGESILSVRTGFNGSFDSVLGPQTVNTIDDLKNYNSALIAAIQSGTLAPEKYVEEFNKAIPTSGRMVYVDAVIDQDDAASQYVNYQRVAYIHGDGGTVNIASDASIQGYSTDSSIVRLDNGGVLNNYGSLGMFNSTSAGSMVVSARNGAVVNNYGVIDAGTNAEMAGYTVNGANAIVFQGHNEGIAANNATVNNQGVINVAPNGSYVSNVGVYLFNNAVMTNTGNLNVSAVERATSPQYSGKFTVGVQLNDVGSKLINEADAELYLGREAQRDLSSASVDISSAAPGSRLVYVKQGLFTNKENGLLTLGSKTQGSYGVVAEGATSNVENSGFITINGAADGVAGAAPLQNVGIMAALGASNVVNASTGNILLNGINSVAMMAKSSVADALDSAVRNAGTITVNRGVDPTTKTANYGLWADGARATVANAGLIDLKGDGAVGAHARNGGTIEVDGAGEMKFDGLNQTGYFVLGAGSKVVDKSTGSQNVTTEGSTLYRIDGGAGFDGAGSTSSLESSGKNSTALLVTSNGQASQLNTGNMSITASGEGATGIKVMGDAQGTLSSDTTLSLTGAGSTAGIVDGSYSDITGAGDSTYRGNATLTSYAMLDNNVATAANAVGFIARNGGTLDHKGSINFTTAGTTGVLVDGGALDNSGDIHVNGVAVNIQGSTSTVTNTGTIEAGDGEAAIKVGNGADLALDGLGIVKASGSAHGILLDTGAHGLTVKDASIIMDPVANGNAIENKAEIAGIKLDNTHITVDNGAGVRTAASMDANNSGTITVNGSGTGLLLQHADGSIADGDMDMSNSRNLVINVNQASGSGIVTNLKGEVKSGASVNVNDAAGGPALKVGGTTSVVEQSGRLVSKSTTNPVVDVNNGYLGSFINRGDIIANSAAQVALEITSGLSGVHFVNAQGGNIIGQVNLTTANNHTVDLQHGSTATDVTSAGGNDTFNLVNIDATDSNLFISLNAGAGHDKLNLLNSLMTLAQTGKTVTGFEEVNLANNSTLTLDNILLPLGDANDDGAGTGFSIGGDSTLVLKQSSDTQFANHISGAGTIAASTAGNTFDFTANNAMNSFSGTLALSDTTFSLEGLNTQALTNATLQASSGSHTTVGDGTQNIGGLRFDGGTLSFDTGTPGETMAKGMVQTANLLDIDGRGTVGINAGSVSNTPTLPPATLSLLQQDEGQLGIKLAGSDVAVTGSGGNLALRDQFGDLITEALERGVIQGGETVANATYDYRLTSGEADDGLYTSYGLTELDLLTSGSNALILNAYGQTGNSADMSAKLTGAGDLAIDTGVGQVVSLSNLDNDYQGKTDVRSGTLLMNNDNVLGQTSELALASGTGFDMNGHHQAVGMLNTQSGSVVNVANGALDITHGGTVDGVLQGSGALNVNGGTLAINGSNAGLTAATSIASGADVQLNNTTGLGMGSISNDGLLAIKNAAGSLFNSLSGKGETQIANASDVKLMGDNQHFSGTFTTDEDSALTVTGQNSLGTAAVSNEGVLNLASVESWTLGNRVTGSGILNQNGSGVVTLTQAAAQFTGDTHVNAGGLQLGSAGSDVTLASGELNIASGATAGGFGGTAGNVNNQGTLLLGALNPLTRATGEAQAFNIAGNLNNDGEASIGRAGDTAGNLLHIAGNYAGNNGHLTFNTVLGDDSSVTDKMVVEGDTQGSTRVSVNNAGGSGAKTLNGIELIRVNGQSDGEFVQEGRIVAGAYDYHLQRGEEDNANHWYLSNTLNEGGGGGNKPDPEVVEVYRPESSAYASNMAAANTLFNTRLHDRLGETHYVDAITGEEKVTSMWLRNVGGHTRSADSSGQMKTQANRYVMQMGGDIAQWSSDGADRYHLGVMAGYANQSSNSRNRLTGEKADGSINGYSLGVYGTWLQDNVEKTGAYVDTWAQYSWFNNTVKGDSLAAESYKSKGITASVESGYTWKVGEKNDHESYYLQPKAQLTWMGVEADSIREDNGTRVEGLGDGNLQARLGVRAFIKGHSQIDEGKNRSFEPFVEANLISNTHSFGSQLNGVNVTQKGARNLGELKVGVEGQIKPGVNLWGNVAQQVGGSGYSDTSALLGVKVSF